MVKEEALKEIVEALQGVHMQLPQIVFSSAELKSAIAERINYLIANDFPLLISILYRLDISEKKLKQLLHQKNNIVAGEIIAEMIIERQLQKIASRKAFKNAAPDVSDAEKW